MDHLERNLCVNHKKTNIIDTRNKRVREKEKDLY